MKCSECKREMVKRSVEGYDLSALVGLPGVSASEALHAYYCSSCKCASFEGAVLERVEHELAEALLEMQRPLRMRELKFLRKFLGLSQQELAERLEVDRVTVGRWETGATKIDQVTSGAVRFEVERELHHPPRNVELPKNRPSKYPVGEVASYQPAC